MKKLLSSVMALCMVIALLLAGIIPAYAADSSFSAQFSYNGKQYSAGGITGTTEISLSTILSSLEITGDVTAASVSEGQGMTVTTTAITLTKAFGTGWLRVTAGGTEYEITITSTPDSISVVLYGTLFFDKNGGSGEMILSDPVDGTRTNAVAVKEYSNYTLPACGYTAPDGYEFSKWEINGIQYSAGDTYLFGHTTTAKAIWVLRAGVHSISANYAWGDGDVVITPTKAAQSETVTVTVQPVAGKAVDSISYSYGSTAAQALSGGDGGVYTFSMPGEDTTVSVTFMDTAKEPVAYVDENNGNQSCNDYCYVRSTDTSWNGWVVASQNLTLDRRVTVSGTVNLILMDGKALTVTNGIQVSENSTLNIYSQSGNTGALIAGNKQLADFTAGIGGDKDNCDAGTITINGGKITAVGGYGGAGIGGGTNWGSKYGKAGSITIRGNADVTATGGTVGAGIGSSYGGKGGSIAISGNATVHANAVGDYSGSGAAIGSGRGGYVNSITISGGTVIATGANMGSAIGNGDSNSGGDGGTISITGGDVTATAKGSWGAGIGGLCKSITIGGNAVVHATGGNRGAGIGGCYQKAVGNITIEGNAYVTATGGASGAGIGTGSEATGEAVITITGGTVNATMSASNDAAAIGSGNKAKGKTTITISGGKVQAYGDNTFGVGIGGGNTGTASEEIIVNISGGTVTATGRVGIGTANASEATQTINISGGTVIASGAIDSGNKAAAIGQGNRSKSPTTINITGGKVTANGTGNGIGAGANSNRIPTVKLRWTGANDEITAISYVGNVTLEKSFMSKSNNSEVFAAGALTDNSVIANKTLIPTDTSKFAVIIGDISYGSITPNPRMQTAGQTVTLTIQPVNGSTMNAGSLSVTYTDGNGTHTVSTVQDSTDSNKYTFTMPGADVTVTATFTSAWQKLQNQINSGTTSITLTGDVVACDGEPALQVPADKTAVIDLNGHKIDRNLSYGIKAGYVMEVRGTLTIKDSSSGQNGKITGGNHKGSSPSTYGGGILVEAQGKLTLQSGSITGNTSEHFGGGVCLKSFGEFYMEGGSITGNTAMNGAGIAARDNSTLSILGGTISGNTASYDGGGVYFDVAANFIMTGGEIKNNTAARDSGGIHYESREKFKFGGSATVTDNTVGGKAYNVRIPDGKTLTIESALTGTIGVTTVTAPTADTPILLTSGLSGKGTTTNFTSDKATYAVDVNTSGEAVLKLPDHIHKFTYSATGATITATCSDTSCALHSSPATLTLSAIDTTYTGSAYAGASLTDTTAWTGAGLTAPTIEYEGRGSTSYTKSTTAPTNAGTYTASITLGDATASVEYTIAKAGISPTLSIQNKTYNGQEITYTIENNPGGGVTSFSWEKENSDNSWSSVSDTPKDAGKYRGTATIAETDNYQGATATTAEFTISKAPLTVTAKPKTITYGDEPTNDGVEYSGFVNGETESVLGGTLDYDYSYLQYGDVGNSYTITPKGLTADNYDITFATGTLTVDQKEVGLEWSGTSLTYSGSAQIPTAEATGIVNNDTISVTVSGGQTNVGTGYTATASGLTGDKAGNYKLPDAKTTTFAIGKAPLIVTAKNHAITYGDEPTNDGVTYSGFVNNDNATVLGGTLDYDYSYTQYGDVGSYTITPKGLTSGNYEIGFDTGTLTVEQKEIGLTWSNTSLTFNGSAQTPTASATGTVNGDVIGVTVSGAQMNVGMDYIATATGLTGEKAGNYQLPNATNTAAFFIEKAAAVTLADVTKSQVYTLTSVTASVAEAMPSNAGELSYAKGTASKTGSVTVSDWNVDSSGTVTVTISGGMAGDTVTLPVTITSTNYTDSTINVVITLTAKHTQTITASNVIVTYGDTGKSVSATTDGDGTLSYAVKSGDAVTVNASSGALTIVKAGTATVTVTASETAAYEQATKDVIVTVNKAASTVTKAPTAKNLTYNGSAQELVTAGTASGGTMQYALGTASKATEQYTISIPTATNAGTYYVWYKVQGDDNHEDSAPACVRVVIKKQGVDPGVPTDALVYNGKEQPLVKAGSVEGGTLVYALGKDGKTAPTKGWSKAVPTEKDAGTYYVWYKVQGDKNHNDTEPVALEAEIARKPLVVTPWAKAKIYGRDDPELTWRQKGLIEGDSLAVTLKRAKGENVGDYAITVDKYETSDNYDVAVNDAVFTIKVRNVTVTARDQAVIKGAAIDKSVGKARLSGQVKGHVLSAVRLTAKGSEIIAAGAKIADANGVDVTGNYSITYAAGKLTVKPKPTVTPKPTAKPTVKPTVTPKPTPTPKPAADPDFTLLARLTVSGDSKTALKLAWTKVKDADGYDVYFARCNKRFKLKKTVKASESRTVRFKGLDKRKSYKGYVKAWKKVGGKKVYIGKASPQVHAITGGYTNHECNARSVKLNKTRLTLKVGRSSALKAKLKGMNPRLKVLEHVAKVRYYSSNANVASVSSGGKVKAVGKGTCTVYAIANNGVRAEVKVTVK